MAFGKRLSLGVALVATTLVGGQSLSFQSMNGLTNDSVRSAASFVIAIVTVGIGAGVLHWLAMQRYERQLRQFVRDANNLAGFEGPNKRPTTSQITGPVAAAIQQNIAAFTKRVDQLLTEPRELEHRLRSSEPERTQIQTILNSITCRTTGT